MPTAADDRVAVYTCAISNNINVYLKLIIPTKSQLPSDFLQPLALKDFFFSLAAFKFLFSHLA
jgi:hypothetical protein